MFDREILRNKELIEERVEYENDFISISDIIKSEELDYYTNPVYDKYIEGDFEIDQIRGISMNDFDMDFEFDDYLDKLHDEQLIEIHEAEIATDYLDIDDYYAEYDPLDAQIEELNDYNPYKDYLEYMAYEDYIRECDLANSEYYFDSPFDDYVEEVDMDGAYCGGNLYGYVVEDDEFDGFGECDYPDGPSENLNGFRYPELEFFDDSSFMDFELQMEAYDEMQSINDSEDDYGEYLVNLNESHMQSLIEEHIREEGEFLQFVKENEIPDEYYIPAGAEDIIFT